MSDQLAPPPLEAPPTARVRAKAERRDALLSSAAQLFAGRGFDGVSIEDLGSSVGVSGPAVYRHFPSKQAVLAALLVGVSEGLLVGGQAVVSSAPDDESALAGLVRFHVDFALRDPDVIRVQDRDLGALSPQDRASVRDLQRRYVDLWVDVLARLQPDSGPRRAPPARPGDVRSAQLDPAQRPLGVPGTNPGSAGGDGPGGTRRSSASLIALPISSRARRHDRLGRL